MLEIDDYVKRIIETKTTLLLGRCGIGVCDLEDIEQELYLVVLEKAHLFDSGRAMASTFLQCILEKKISEILSRKTAELACKTFTELKFTPTEMVDKNNHSDEEQLKLDLEALFDSMSEKQVHACFLLGEGVSVTDAARLLGIKRSTFYSQIINPLRKSFKEKGMNFYLQK
jgi:DNA-directed RNA polymerase specialized sigma24 family protein